MKTFKGRVILGGNLAGEALVTHQGFNTLAAYVQGLITKSPICHDQNNPDLYQKHIAGKVLCSTGDHRLHHRRNGAAMRSRRRHCAGRYALRRAHRFRIGTWHHPR